MKNRGITLIALVITIIVLLILAGITISLTIGNQGIITRAQQASRNYKDAEQKEQDELNNFDTELDNIISGLGTTKPEPLSGIQPGQISKETKKYNYVDADSDVATVPAGFTVSGIPEEQHINSGLVIYDIPEDEIADIDWTSEEGKKSVQEKYNQFVWIPCTVTQYNDAKDDVMDMNWSSNNKYKDNGDTDYGKTDGQGEGRDWRDIYTTEDKETINKTYNNGDETSPTLPTEKWINENQIDKATTSIGTYGGFYIGRYEAGIPNDATEIYAYDEGDAYIVAGRGATGETSKIKGLSPVSKRGKQAWNSITQPNAKLVSENMYDSSVKSYLIDSQAWNLICHKFDNILGKTDEEKTIMNSTKFGNYFDNEFTDYSKVNGLWALHTWKNNDWNPVASQYKNGVVDSAPKGVGECRLELATGLSDDFKIYNIYDMAGNMWEWTTGHNIKNGTMFVVIRGGSFYNVSQGAPLVSANGGDTMTRSIVHIGFRVVLYIK